MSAKLRQIQDWRAQAQAANWCAATLAKNCGVSPATLRRHFRRVMGKSVRAWMLNELLYVSLGRLSQGQTLKETAVSLGYDHQTNFARRFKGYWKYTPTQFQKPAPEEGQNEQNERK